MKLSVTVNGAEILAGSVLDLFELLGFRGVERFSPPAGATVSITAETAKGRLTEQFEIIEQQEWLE